MSPDFGIGLIASGALVLFAGHRMSVDLILGSLTSVLVLLIYKIMLGE